MLYVPESKVVYALVSIASSFRFGLTRDEIIVAAGGDGSNAVLNQIDQLAKRHVIVVSASGELRARHRVIADLVVDELRKSGSLVKVLTGLALVAASKVTLQLKRSSRPWRMLRSVLNHDFLIRTVGPENARNLYGSLEGILTWDYQFWLQRGSLEVESGEDLSLAENFLNQSIGLAPDDPFVQTEYAYLQFRKAGADPLNVDAPTLVKDATSTLRDLILKRGEGDGYPYHVLGSQGLMWARRGLIDPKAKDIYLRQIISLIQDGVSKHAHSSELRQLLDDLRRELLSIAVR